MFGIFTGVITNTLAVVAGTAAGCVFKGEKLKTIGERIFQGFGLFTIVLGISSAIGLEHPLFMLASIIIGTAIGELVDLDEKFNRFGDWLKKRFAKDGSSGFTEGFISGTLLFCVGSMTIMGALQSGLENRHTIYFTKSVLDCFSSCMFAMGGGAGVGFAAIIVLVYQGLLVALASLLTPVMTPEIVAISSAVGGLSLLGLGLNMLGITKLKVANFLPAMFVPIVYQIIVVLFHLEGVL
jgi:hypothetical protein